jgi:hypothetical protein
MLIHRTNIIILLIFFGAIGQCIAQKTDSLDVNTPTNFFIEIGLVDVVSQGGITDLFFGFSKKIECKKLKRDLSMRIAYDRYKSNEYFKYYTRFNLNGQESRKHGFYFNSAIEFNLFKDIQLRVGPEIVFYDYERYEKQQVNNTSYINLMKEKYIGLGPVISLAFFASRKLCIGLETSYAFGYFAYDYINLMNYNVIFSSRSDFFRNGIRPVGNSNKYLFECPQLYH